MAKKIGIAILPMQPASILPIWSWICFLFNCQAGKPNSERPIAILADYEFGRRDGDGTVCISATGGRRRTTATPGARSSARFIWTLHQHVRQYTHGPATLRLVLFSDPKKRWRILSEEKAHTRGPSVRVTRHRKMIVAATVTVWYNPTGNGVCFSSFRWNY